MNFTDYYNEAKTISNYNSGIDIYNLCSIKVEPNTNNDKIGNLDNNYMKFVNDLSNKVNINLSNNKVESSKLLIIDDNFIDYKEELNGITDIILPNIEKNIFGCNVFVDKIYIYRNIHYDKLSTSWLWHYDNNPYEVLKIMIYLTDVDKKSGPFQQICDKDNNGSMKAPSRTGPSNWKTPPPNGSRISENEINSLLKNNKLIKTNLGPKGTLILFSPQCIHRATSPDINNYRDVLIIRVRPTINKKYPYVDEKWTGGFKHINMSGDPDHYTPILK